MMRKPTVHRWQNPQKALHPRAVSWLPAVRLISCRSRLQLTRGRPARNSSRLVAIPSRGHDLYIIFTISNMLVDMVIAVPPEAVATDGTAAHLDRGAALWDQTTGKMIGSTSQ